MSRTSAIRMMVVLFSLFAFTQSTVASYQLETQRTDDSDLSSHKPTRIGYVRSDLTPDSIEVTPGPNPLTLFVERLDHGQISAVSDLTFSFSISNGSMRLTTDSQGMIRFPARYRCATEKVHAVAELTNQQFEVENYQDRHTFRISADLPCSGSVRMLFKQDSDVGQAVGIWQIAARARAALSASIGLSFWTSRLTFSWPADGDYYSAGIVHITRGDQWDVVGHEMGHAIYDLGALGRFGGGQHKIDECYSKALALSEGWASYFSAWVSVSLADPDAKFEYMVPRRAPIRFENIPADVCKGENNEWRVTGFFWDLADLHKDGESMNESFARLWNALKGSRVGSASEAMQRFQKAGIDANGLRTVWVLNFQTQSPY